MVEQQFPQVPVADSGRWAKIKPWLCRIGKAMACMASTALMVVLLTLVLGTASEDEVVIGVNSDAAGLFSTDLTHRLQDALDGLIPTKRIYKLSDRDLVAPQANPANYGQTKDPTELTWLLTDAEELLNGQSTLFTPETRIRRGTSVRYYLDKTILAVTWKQVYDECEYTFCEVKIDHPTQFRRYLSDGKYNSGVLHTTTEMSQTVNAVAASAGDYYVYRKYGVVVNNGTVYRADGKWLDTCFIDDNGDLIFSKRGEITDQESAEKFVEEHSARFSLSFGPVMIQDGKYCVPYSYAVGELQDEFARAALCQLDELHYLVVTANIAFSEEHVPTMAQFARPLMRLGITTAYAIDGGQTATIAMDHQLVNRVSYGAQREISDIFYFASAVPTKEWEDDT